MIKMINMKKIQKIHYCRTGNGITKEWLTGNEVSVRQLSGAYCKVIRHLKSKLNT